MSATALPELREELHLFAGGPDAEGAPTWNLHDPVRNQFFRIDWSTFEILARWGLRSPEAIAASVSDDTTLEIEPDDVDAVQAFLRDNQLVQLGDAEGSRWLTQQEKARHSTLWHWLLHHYLFFRVPLVRPDRWLTRQLPHVAPFYSRRFFQITGIVLLFGLFECYRQWSHFSAMLVDSFSLKGLVGYGIALMFVKTLHELGHAFTAKRLGCRVPTMGVAFLVMWPVAYTDVNEVWKLPHRRDRLAVGAAGIVTELVVAAWATLAWALLPDGTLRGIAFLLATTTWISTIAINASPFMRFDGYFLMADFLNFPNLHARSFALARWDLRERLFGLNEPAPEVLPPGRRRALVVFAWMVWLYRLVLFLGIAVLVYHFFIKALGIVLFVVEIGVFIVQPIWREIKAWRTRAGAIRNSPRALRSLLLAGGLLLIGFLPWSSHLSGQGVLRPTQYLPLYAPGPARIDTLGVGAGGQVAAGTLLIGFDTPDIEQRRKRAEQQLRQSQWLLEVSGLDNEMRANQSIFREELAGAKNQLADVGKEQARFQIHAPFAGVLVDVAPELREGVWVGPRERLGVLIDPSAWQVETYLTDSDIQRVHLGYSARFFPEASGLEPLHLRVVRIDPDATRQLPEPMLSAQHGGEVATREHNGHLIPDQAIYRVVLQVQPDDLPTSAAHVLRGRVVIDGDRRSLLGGYMRTAATVLIRETGW